MCSAQLYDTIGATYTVTRRTEPRIAARVWAALGHARTVLNVGAGTGSYEPPGRDVTAVEPSALMRAQRPAGAAPCVAATGRAHPVPEPLELALDPDHAPPRILPGHLNDQTNQRGIERRSASLAVPERPFAPDELPVPADDRRRGHDEPTPAVAADQIRQHRDHHPVPAAQARPGVRPLQDRELMTEHQDLSFALARVISCGPEQARRMK